VNRLERARAGRRPASGEKASAVVWEADSLMMGMDNPITDIPVHSTVRSFGSWHARSRTEIYPTGLVLVSPNVAWTGHW